MSFFNVFLQHNCHMLNSTVYKKPMKDNAVISFYANLPFNYHIGTFKSFMQKAFLIYSGIQLKQELNFTKQIAVDQGFPIRYIYNVIHQQHIFSLTAFLITSQTQHIADSCMSQSFLKSYGK